MIENNNKNSDYNSDINNISESIVKIEKELFYLRLKKATRQDFKSHKMKTLKRQLAKLKASMTTITLINNSFK